MKTYHMYHSESLSAENKLKEAEKQEEKHIGKTNDISAGLLRYGHDERSQRRSSVKKMEKMKEKVSSGTDDDSSQRRSNSVFGKKQLPVFFQLRL